MKKCIVVILLMVYGMTSFGFSLNYFYCCDKLKDVSISLNGSQAHDCDMTMKDKKKCCDNKSVTLKLSPDQKANFNQNYNVQPFNFAAVMPELYGHVAISVSTLTHPQFFNLPPPLLRDRTIQYANIRI